jgi:hypothetical protein
MVDVATKLGIDLISFRPAVALKKGELAGFERAVQTISDAVCDGDTKDKSREGKTSLVRGVNRCAPFRGERHDNDILEGEFPLHTPGANRGVRPIAQEAPHFNLQRQVLGEHTDPHDPAVARGDRQAQGIMHDNRMVAFVTDKRRYYMALWDPEAYPFGCAKECPSREAERELAFELLVAYYPKYVFDDIAHGDVATAMGKSAAAVCNDDPVHKSNMQIEMQNIRLGIDVPFEQGIRLLWAKVENVEAMTVMVITGLPVDQVDKRKREMLYCFLQDNANFKEVI